MEELLAALTERNWPLVSLLVIGFLVRLLKQDTKLPITIPARWRPWIAMALGAASGVLEQIVQGTPWNDALLGGVAAALVAMGGHNLVVEGLLGGKEIPIPGLTKKKGSNVGSFVAIVFAVLFTSGCASWKQGYSEGGVLGGLAQLNEDYGPGFDTLVQMACAREYSAQKRIDLQAAKEQFCSTTEQVKPWIDLVLAAQQRGGARAGIRAEE